MILPPSLEVCQTCAVQHAPEDPHDATSLYFRMKFHAEQGRWPAWADAAAHCDMETQQLWREALAELGHSWTAVVTVE